MHAGTEDVVVVVVVVVVEVVLEVVLEVVEVVVVLVEVVVVEVEVEVELVVELVVEEVIVVVFGGWIQEQNVLATLAGRDDNVESHLRYIRSNRHEHRQDVAEALLVPRWDSFQAGAPSRGTRGCCCGDWSFRFAG